MIAQREKNEIGREKKNEYHILYDWKVIWRPPYTSLYWIPLFEIFTQIHFKLNSILDFIYVYAFVRFSSLKLNFKLKFIKLLSTLILFGCASLDSSLRWLGAMCECGTMCSFWIDRFNALQISYWTDMKNCIAGQASNSVRCWACVSHTRSAKCETEKERHTEKENVYSEYTRKVDRNTFDFYGSWTCTAQIHARTSAHKHSYSSHIKWEWLRAVTYLSDGNAKEIYLQNTSTVIHNSKHSDTHKCWFTHTLAKQNTYQKEQHSPYHTHIQATM